MPNMIHMTNATHGDGVYYIIPFVYAYESAGNAEDSTYFPLSLSIDEFVAMWWTWETLTAAVTLDHGTGLQTSANVTLTRNAADEQALAVPGASADDIIGLPLTVAGRFTGTYEDPDWNGSDGALSITASLRIGHWCLDDSGANPDSQYECSQRLYWQPDDTLHPSIILSITYTISSPGTEQSATVTNYIPISAPPALSSFGGTASINGDSFALGVLDGDEYDPAQIAVVITPASFFEWGGVRVAGTGAVAAGRYVRELLAG